MHVYLQNIVDAEITASQSNAAHLLDYDAESTVLAPEEQLLPPNLPILGAMLCGPDNRSFYFLTQVTQ